MILVDTGYLIALADPADVLRERASQWLRVNREKLLVTEYVLWETVNALSDPRDHPRVHHLVRRIRASQAYEVIPASPELIEAGLELHARRPDKEWSLTDCISFLVMERRGVTRALAYDHHFEQAG